MADHAGRPSAKALTLAAVVMSAVGVAVLLVASVQQPGRGAPKALEALEAQTNTHDVHFFTMRARRDHRESRVLSRAHREMLALTMLGCECQDITNIISADNTWGHYTPKCCNKLKEKTSVASVMGRDISQAQANTKALRAALKSAKEKLNKQMSVVVDAVTLRNGGRPGEKGPVGRKGPQGYVGVPGGQGKRGPLGVVGPRGPKGHPGQIGYRGDTGDMGAKGTQGWEGTPGAPGYIGPDGPRGIVGLEGPPGPEGAKGPIGNQGSLGRTGGQGAEGNTGPAGREIIFNGYTASTQCEWMAGYSLRYLDRYDITCQGELGVSFINRYEMTRKCPYHSYYGMKYERTCINAGVWRKAGAEGTTVNCNGYLRFGAGNKWAKAKLVSGLVGCNTKTFGDPAPGIPKECQCSSNHESGATQCSNHDTGCQYNGNIEYLDRQGVNCPTGKALVKNQLHACSGGVTTKFTCCTPTWGMGECETKYTTCSHSNGYGIDWLSVNQNIQCPEYYALTSTQYHQWGCHGGYKRYKYTCCRLKK